jgi:arginyl-tRNA synthetase
MNLPLNPRDFAAKKLHTIAAGLGETLTLEEIIVSIAIPEAQFGDYSTNIAFSLAKARKTAPLALAEEFVKKLLSDPEVAEVFQTIEAVRPGFINLSLSAKTLSQHVEVINKNPDTFGASTIRKKELVLVEYFQLNVAKPPHVGHIRSAVIGDSLKRIFIAQGYKTVSDTHIGDWGTQFGILLWAYKNLDGRSRIGNDPLEELNALYVEANTRIEAEPEIREQAKLEFVKLEQGDKENRKLWEFFVSVSRREFDKMTTLLKLLPFEYDLGESFYEKLMKQVIADLEKADLLKTGETGERYIDLEEWNLGRLICIKSDGGTTYSLRDLATVVYRYTELPKKEKTPLALSLYLIDNRQSHFITQAFKAMELLGYDMTKSVHVDYGFLSLPEGAMSTRKGNVIRAEAIVQEANQRALQIINEKNPNLTHKEHIAEQVGLGAIKYADLSHNRKGDIVFRWETALSFEGNTGPYLQYTYARLNSIVRKSQDDFLQTKDSLEKLTDPAEQDVARKLVHFAEAVELSAKEMMPHHLANYLYELSGLINRFYQAVPVLIEPNKELRCARLSLVAASATALKNGLYLLGIEAPAEM